MTLVGLKPAPGRKQRTPRKRVLRHRRHRHLPQPDLATIASVAALSDSSFWEPLPPDVAEWMGMATPANRPA